MKTLDEIFGKRKSLDDIFSQPQFSDEAKAQVQANNQAYALRQEENRPWFDKNPAGRVGIAALQGISNSSLNPAGYVARAAGIDTKPFTPQTAIEKGTELAGEYGFDTAALGGIGKIAQGAGYLGKGKGVASKVAQDVLAPENTTALLSRFVAPAAGGGLVEGITDPRNPFERTLANITGAGIVGGIEGGLRRTATNTAGGLKEALPNERANAALSKGITADKGVARTISKEAPAVYDELNADMTQALNKATGRKLDIEQANQNARNAYENYIAQNADYPVFNPKSAKEQAQQNFNRWNAGNTIVDENGNILKLYHQTDADFDIFQKGRESAGKYDYETPDGFFFKSNDKDIGLHGKKQVPVYIRGKKGLFFKNREDARKYFRENIDGYDDLLTKYNNVDNEYLAKEAARETRLDKMIDDLEKSPQYRQADNATQLKMREDVINSFDDDAFYDEWRVAGNKYAAQMKEKINKYVKDNNFDFMKLDNDAGGIGKKTTDAYIVFDPKQIKSVNNSGAWSESPSLSDAGWKAEPSIKDIKLNQYQQNAMNKALAEGASMSDYPLGSLDATHKAQGVLNDMINASYDSSNPLKPRATTETSQLMSLKKVFNELMEPSGVKPLDARISKAKTLRSNFEKGYNFKPSETKFDNLGLNTARDKKAFLQGRLAKLQDNVLSEGGTNLADAIIKDQNTLKKLMPKKQFDSLMNTAGSLKESFSRLKSIEGQADRELVKDVERGTSTWRENFDSIWAPFGRAIDVAENAVTKTRRRNLANAYLNPKIDEIRQFGGLLGSLKGAGSASLRQALIDALN